MLPNEETGSPKAAAGKNTTILLCLLLAGITLALFWPATRYGFVDMDDDLYVYQNPGVTAGLTWAGVKWAFTTIHAGYWIPLTWVSLMLDDSCYGLFAGGYHLTNLLIHVVNTLILFLLFKRTTQALWPSALVAALFAWHPLHLESVAWVTERKDVLSTFFLLLTLRAYSCHAERPAAGRLLLSLVFFVLGLMAKPMLVTLPVMLLLLDFWPLNRLPPTGTDRVQARNTYLKLLLEKIPFLAIALVAGLATIVTQRLGGGVVSLGKLTFGFRAANAIVSYADYLWKTLCPVNLCAYYPLSSRPPALTVTAAILVILGISYLVLRRGRRSPWLVTGWFWYLLVLLPVSGVLQSGGQAMADRFTYVPLIGIFIMVAWSADRWLAGWPAARVWGFACLGGALAMCILVTRMLLPTWSDSLSLFTRVLAVTQDNAFAENNVGIAWSDAGNGKEAIFHFRKALRILPYYDLAHYNLGLELAAQGRPAEAAEHFSLLLQYEPGNERLHNNLGTMLAEEGKLAAATKEFQQAIQLKPDYAKACLNLAVALQKLGQNGPACTYFLRALQLEPEGSEALNLTAVFLATCPDSRWRNPAEAIDLSLHLNKISNADDPAYLRTLALAYASAGKFPEAESTAQLALQKARTAGATGLASQLAAELTAYQNGRILPLDERPAGFKPEK